MKFSYALPFGTLATAMIAAPIFAQQGSRASTECRQEVVDLCGTDRSEIRACLQERLSELSSACSAEVRERAQQRRGERGERGQRRSGERGERRGERRERPVQQQAGMPVSATAFYGADPRQVVDFYAPADGPQTDRWDNLPPLVLFVHGGGWSFGDHKMSAGQKPAHFTGAGYAFASTGYRLMPDAPVEEQAKDIASAISVLRAQAGELGFDPDTIIMMGHSAGAHLAALVSSDPQSAGDAFGAIKGVILLDGAGYDIASSMASANPRAKALYTEVFGTDPARQSALSPITHVGAPDAPNWLILHVADRGRSAEQSQMLASKLSAAGANAAAVPVANTDHRRLNQELGASGDPATARVDAFLEQFFG